MFHELKQDEFQHVRSLFDGFDYSLSIQAAIAGNNPGRIFVDDVAHPRTALALTVEGYLLAGEANDPVVNEGLHQLFKERIFSGEVFVNGDDSLSLAVHPETWEAKLPGLLPTQEFAKIDRYHYLCREVKFDWRSHIPEGYTIHRVDYNLLHDPNIVFSDAVREWMEIDVMWGTEDHFLSKGVGFVVLLDGEVVTWCSPDCFAGDRIDIGIFTHRAHRRKGLAVAAVAATVEHCLAHGFSAVGWHCNAINTASWKTAEKVGFVRNREYTYYYCMYDPLDNLLDLGWYHYQCGDYNKTVQYYERVFGARSENPDYSYHLIASACAQLGDKDKALKFLNMAADRGWRHVDYTKAQQEFCILHNTPEWDAVLSRMQ